MYLLGVGCEVPSQQIDNDEILELVSYYSRTVYAGRLRDLMFTIQGKLDRSEARTRYWRTDKERPFELLKCASENALARSNVDPNDIDYVIYVGVDRGFAEPANACFVAKELGIYRARTFDIADACLGWSTGTEIAQALFASAPGALALIVSAEFPMRSGGSVLPGCFSIASNEELDWKFPAMTLGEAATASVLSGGGRSWRYVCESFNELADLCTVGLGPPADYAGPSSRFSVQSESGFRAYGWDLANRTARPAVRVLRELLHQSGEPKVIFPHSVIGSYVSEVAARARPGLSVFSTFADLGNVATSSLPSCIDRARQQGVLLPGDFAIGWVAASGLKVSAFEILQR